MKTHLPRVLIDLVLDYIRWACTPPRFMPTEGWHSVGMFGMSVSGISTPRFVLASDLGVLAWNMNDSARMFQVNGIHSDAKVDPIMISHLGTVWGISNSQRSRGSRAVVLRHWYVDNARNWIASHTVSKLDGVESVSSATVAGGHLWLLHDANQLSKRALHPNGRRLDMKSAPYAITLPRSFSQSKGLLSIAVIKNTVALLNRRMGELVVFCTETGRQLQKRNLSQSSFFLFAIYDNFLIGGEAGWLEVLNPLTLETETKIKTGTSGIVLDLSFYCGMLIGTDNRDGLFVIQLSGDNLGEARWKINQQGQLQERTPEQTSKQQRRRWRVGPQRIGKRLASLKA